MDLPKPLSVAEYIAALNLFFKGRQDRIQGEVSQLKLASSGHVYFTLKDKSGEGVLDCIMWKGTYALCDVKLEAGLEVIVSGHPNIYGPTGRFSVVADSVELVGEGALKKAYDDLKRKLEEEGLFAPERKRPVPDLPQKIGVITSREGAVIFDFRHNLGNFGYTVKLMDSRVEGQAALPELNAAIQAMRTQDIDVLVVIRGGGSLESLQAFNNEALVRAITDFPVPVIVGVGHDQDVCLLALAADHMTSTPTAAAHLLNRSWEDAYAKVRQVAHILGRVEQEFSRLRSDLDLAWSTVIDHAEEKTQQLRTYLDLSWNTILDRSGQRLAVAGQKLDFAERTVKLNDPRRQLKLGYSIVRQAGRNGKVIKTAKGLAAGDTLETQFADGAVRSIVAAPPDLKTKSL